MDGAMLGQILGAVLGGGQGKGAGKGKGYKGSWSEVEKCADGRGLCMGFKNNGVCGFMPCKYAHVSPSGEILNPIQNAPGIMQTYTATHANVPRTAEGYSIVSNLPVVPPKVETLFERAKAAWNKMCIDPLGLNGSQRAIQCMFMTDPEMAMKALEKKEDGRYAMCLIAVPIGLATEFNETVALLHHDAKDKVDQPLGHTVPIQYLRQFNETLRVNAGITPKQFEKDIVPQVTPDNNSPPQSEIKQLLDGFKDMFQQQQQTINAVLEKKSTPATDLDVTGLITGRTPRSNASTRSARSGLSVMSRTSTIGSNSTHRSKRTREMEDDHMIGNITSDEDEDADVVAERQARLAESLDLGSRTPYPVGGSLLARQMESDRRRAAMINDAVSMVPGVLAQMEERREQSDAEKRAVQAMKASTIQTQLRMAQEANAREQQQPPQNAEVNMIPLAGGLVMPSPPQFAGQVSVGIERANAIAVAAAMDTHDDSVKKENRLRKAREMLAQRKEKLFEDLCHETERIYSETQQLGPSKLKPFDPQEPIRDIPKALLGKCDQISQKEKCRRESVPQLVQAMDEGAIIAAKDLIAHLVGFYRSVTQPASRLQIILKSWGFSFDERFARTPMMMLALLLISKGTREADAALVAEADRKNAAEQLLQAAASAPVPSDNAI